ncbi:MAG: oxidoreductase [Subtercola sp.]|nr:oxidoreductase [Subtercola sp.]
MTNQATRTGPVGVGVIGAGVISTQYLENLVQFADVKVLFIADIDLERASAQAKAFGVPESGTVDELLAKPEIEIVINLTIPAAHVAVALQALAAGKNVWNEKPFALDRASGRQLLDAARAAGLRVATAPDTILGPGLQAGRRLIENGAIGVPKTAITQFLAPGPESWHPSPEFLFDIGGGPLFDIGPYYVTTLVQIFGTVSRVSALASKSRETRTIGSGPRAGTDFAVNVPTHVSALIEFASGASAQSTFSFDSGITRVGIVEFTGTEGTIIFPDPNQFVGELSVYHPNVEPEIVSAAGSSYSRGTGVVELARAIRAGRPERASGEQAYHVTDVLIAIAEAAEYGHPIDVASTVTIGDALPEDWDPSASTL